MLIPSLPIGSSLTAGQRLGILRLDAECIVREPDAREVRFAVGGSRRSSGQVGLSVGGLRNARGGIFQPLGAGRCGPGEGRGHGERGECRPDDGLAHDQCLHEDLYSTFSARTTRPRTGSPASSRSSAGTISGLRFAPAEHALEVLTRMTVAPVRADRVTRIGAAPLNSSTVKTSRPPGRSACAEAATTSSSGPKYTSVSADTITSNVAGGLAQIGGQFTFDELVVDIPGPGLCQHARGQVDAHQPARIRGDERPAQAGAAAGIEHVESTSRARPPSRPASPQPGRGAVQQLGELGIEAAGETVERHVR